MPALRLETAQQLQRFQLNFFELQKPDQTPLIEGVSSRIAAKISQARIENGVILKGG